MTDREGVDGGPSWAALFERAEEYDASVESVRAALAGRRDDSDG